MAAAIFNKLASDRGIDAAAVSAGVAAEDGCPASANAVKALEKIGLDLSRHRSQKTSEALFDECFLVVPLSSAHAAFLIRQGCPQSKIFLPSVEVNDPFGGYLDTYEKCRDQIKKLCEEVIDVIEDMNNENSN